MKRFFGILGILIIIGGLGAVFYLGWIQIRLGANDYGVVFTKMKGYDEVLIEPGKFTWRWEALIPANLTLHLFHLTPRNSRVSLKGELPSGKLYGQVFDGQPDFSYDLTLSLSYMLKPEALPRLAREAYVTPQGLSEWYKGQEDAALVEAAWLLKERMEGPDFSEAGELLPRELERELTEGLNVAFPDLNFTQAAVVNLKLPDAELYRRARRDYFSLMDNQKALRLQALEESIPQTMGQRTNLDILKNYGELFTTYPILLEYLSLHPEGAEDIFRGAGRGE